MSAIHQLAYLYAAAAAVQLPIGADAPGLLNFTNAQCGINSNLISMCFGNTKYVAIAQNSNSVSYSWDGVNWQTGSRVTLAAMTFKSTIKYVHDRYFIVGSEGYWAYSMDGVSWYTYNIGRNVTLNDVIYFNGKWCIIADQILTSSDLNTWSTVPGLPGSPNGSASFRAAAGTGIAVACAYHQESIAYSTDGMNWQQSTSRANMAFTHVAYGNGVFVSTDTYGSVGRSTDGINWIQIPITDHTGSFDLAFGNGKFYILVANGVRTSIDGINWTSQTLNGSWSSLMASNDKVVIAAANGNLRLGV